MKTKSYNVQLETEGGEVFLWLVSTLESEMTCAFAGACMSVSWKTFGHADRSSV